MKDDGFKMIMNSIEGLERRIDKVKYSIKDLKEINKDRVAIDKSNSYNFEGVTGERLNVIGKLIGKGVDIDE